MWFVLTQYFGLRGCQEHICLYVEDFSFSKDENGVEYRQFAGNNNAPWALFEAGSPKVLEGKARFFRERGYEKRHRALKVLTTKVYNCCGP